MRNRKNRISRAVTAMLILVMTTLIFMALHTGREVVERLDEYAVARTEYADLRDLAGAGVIPPLVGGEVDAEIEDTPHPSIEPSSTQLDWDALRAINPDVVGWIVVPDTPISYPIVRGQDNAHYLRHTFSGERNASGAIFMDYRNSADFSDNQIILHGHNMRDGSMFAPLHGWTGDYFIIHTPDGIMVFEVFDRRMVSATDEIYQLHDMENGEQIVTLSTCVNGRAEMRFVVRGIKG